MDNKIIYVEQAIGQCRICAPATGPVASQFNNHKDDKHGMLLVINHPDDFSTTALNTVFGLDWEEELDITYWIRCTDIPDEDQGREACAVYTKNMMSSYPITILLEHPDYEQNKATKIERNRYVVNIKNILQKGVSFSDLEDAKNMIDEVKND